MTDIFDRASELEQADREAALQRARPKPAASITVLLCHDCGDEIPAARRKAVPGCCRCVACQLVHEHQGKLHK